MTTGQKYVDGPNNAPSTEPAAQQTSFRQWQAQFLHQSADDFQYCTDLFDLIEGVRELHETIDPTEGICMLLGEFLTQHRGDLGRHKYELAAVVRMIGLINGLKETFACFNNETDYINQYEGQLDQLRRQGKEVGHE